MTFNHVFYVYVDGNISYLWKKKLKEPTYMDWFNCLKAIVSQDNLFPNFHTIVTSQFQDNCSKKLRHLDAIKIS